ESASTACCEPSSAPANESARHWATITGEAATVKPRSACETASIISAPVEAAAVVAPTIKTAPVESPPPIETVEPRTSADEHASDKPVRTVVAIGRAIIGIIRVVAVGTYGCRSIGVRRTVSHAHHHPLRARLTCAQQANAEQ